MSKLKKNNQNLNNINVDNIYVDNINIDDECDTIDNNVDIISNVNTNIISINEFKKKEKMLYEVLNDFFKKCSLSEIELMILIIDGKHENLSLRFLDWFVTRYCYLYKLSIGINNSYIKEQNFNINISYKAQLKSFK